METSDTGFLAPDLVANLRERFQKIKFGYELGVESLGDLEWDGLDEVAASLLQVPEGWTENPDARRMTREEDEANSHSDEDQKKTDDRNDENQKKAEDHGDESQKADDPNDERQSPDDRNDESQKKPTIAAKKARRPAKPLAAV